MLLIVTSTADELVAVYHRWPWTPKMGCLSVFCDFWLLLEWIATKWLKIDQDNLTMYEQDCVLSLSRVS